MADELLSRPIPDGWEATTLGEIVARGGGQIQTGPFGTQLHASDYVANGIPCIMPVNIGDRRIKEEGIARITEQDAARLSRHRVKAGDIIYSRRGNIERCALIQPEQEGWLCGTGCLKVRLGDGQVDPRFASYYLSDGEVRSWLVRHAVGATMPNLNTSIMEAIPFVVPPLREQQAIAWILGTLDDKIELNRRRNRTLEAMARAIFQSWFVDFDPVKAKAAVRREHPKWTDEQVSRAACPKLKPELAALFPDRFEDSPLGPIPAGWRVGTLSEVCEKPQYGFTASATEEPIGPRFLRITDINKTDWIEWDRVPYCEIDDVNRTKYALRPGDLVIARMADPGHGALMEEAIDAVFASYLIRFRPRTSGMTRYLQYWVRSSAYWHLVTSCQSGTTRANLNAKVLGGFALLLPPREIVARFANIIDALRNRLVANLSQSRTLAALRDALLPKLISGELRVPDAERIVGRAT